MMYSLEDFITVATINKLKEIDNPQLWQFSVSDKNRGNYGKEIYNILKGRNSIWSKPDALHKYINNENILIVTDKNTTDVFKFSLSNQEPREYWSNKNKIDGTINLVLIGKFHYDNKKMASFCNYVKWMTQNKFQPVKKVTFKEFISNIESYCTSQSRINYETHSITGINK